MTEQVPSKELCEHDWVGDDFCAYCDADAARDMLTDARLELDELRQALGVDYEPHQSLRERMLDAANHKRVERTAPDRCGRCDGSQELVMNDSGGDPAYDYSIPCPECSAHEPCPAQVWICSNPQCRAAFDSDPQGHCPVCKQENGSGWSTICTNVRTITRVQLCRPADRAMFATEAGQELLKAVQEHISTAPPPPVKPATFPFSPTECPHTEHTFWCNGCGVDVRNARAAQPPLLARPLDEWHEDMGDVVWWKFPMDESAYIGSPLASDWPGYHTHWTPHPALPECIRYSTATKEVTP